MTAAHAPAHAALRAAPRRAAALRPPQSPRPPPCPTSRACPSEALQRHAGATCTCSRALRRHRTTQKPPEVGDLPAPAPAIRKSHQLPANNLRALEETLRVRRVPWHCASLHCHRPAPSSLQRTVPPPAATMQSEHAPLSRKGACLLCAHQACVLARPCLALSQPGNRRCPRINGSSGSR